jgi:hypothetical protein
MNANIQRLLNGRAEMADCKARNFYGARCSIPAQYTQHKDGSLRLRPHPGRHVFRRVRRHRHNSGCEWGRAHGRDGRAR